MTATPNEVQSGNVIVVPDRLMNSQRPKTTHHGGTFAASIENARGELSALNLEEDQTSSESDASPLTPGSPATPSDLPTADTFAFAFDIDGVLIRGGAPIPEAIEAMKMLNGENEWGVKVPYIFLTNGGGKTEAERCIDLSRQLDIEVAPAQFICGHTPMREMVEKHHTVLVIGGEGEKCREVAEGYGFKDVVTPGDMIKDNPHTTPFRRLTEDEFSCSKKRNFSETKIDAIFVFADSRDWAADIQIMLDLAMSKGGYMGTISKTSDEGPPIYFSHNDIVWSAAHKNVRIGMGALRKVVETLFYSVTGKELETIAFGKPQIGTFEFATRLLQQWRKDEHRINAPPETVYFVGDTPESDIQGTNRYNEKAKNDWYSILVETGVYQAGTEPAYKPRVTVTNVLEAVKHGMQREFETKGNAFKGGNINTMALRKALLKDLTEGKVVDIMTPIIGSEAGTPEAATPL